jgi:hypothetical protein
MTERDIVERLRGTPLYYGHGEESDLPEAAAAEIAALRARVAAGLAACDRFDGPASGSEFLNGQATAAQQIRAALRSAGS